MVAHSILHTFTVDIPSDVLGKRLDTVLLEFDVDVVLDSSEHPDMSPMIAVFPLEEQYSASRSPVYSTSYSSARNINVGTGQRVQVDITEIVRRWIENPSSNHGLILGSFTGPKVSTLNLRSDVVAAGKAARVTFFYQNRFGQRVSGQK